jgi:hypothetical protein
LTLAKDQSMIVDYFIENGADDCMQMERPQQCVQNGVERPQCAGCVTLREE